MLLLKKMLLAFLTAILMFLNVHYVEMNKEDKMEFNKRGV